MAVIAVGVIGAALASSATAAVAGAVGSTVLAGVIVAGVQAAAGAAASMADAEMFGERGARVNLQGPRIAELTTQKGVYGSPLPVIYGSGKVGGVILWARDLKETPKEDVTPGGKKKASGGGQSLTRYTYSVTAALAISGKPISKVLRIYAAGKLLWDSGTTAEASDTEADGGMIDKDGDGVAETKVYTWDVRPEVRTAEASYVYADDGTPISMTVTGTKAARITAYMGSEYQMPDPLIASVEGPENTPAYRGTAYVVIEDLQVADFGNSLPAFTIVVSSGDADQEWIALNPAETTVAPRGMDGGVPVTLNYAGRGWGVFGIDAEGRVRAQTYRENRRRTGAERVDDVAGPLAAGADIRRLDALIDPTGRFVAVIMRGYGAPHPTGWLQLCVYDVYRNSFLGSRVQPVPDMSDIGGDEPTWVGDIIASPSSRTVGPGSRDFYGWRVTAAGAVQEGLQFFLPLGYGSIEGYQAHNAVVACNQDLMRPFFLSSFVGSSTGVARLTKMGAAGAAGSIGQTLFTGRALGGINQRGRAERLPSGEWLLISEGQGQGAVGWIATISADGESVTRAAYDIDGAEGLPTGRLAIANLRSRGRIAVLGYQTGDVPRFAEVTMTDTGFEVTRPSAPLGGAPVPGADDTGYRSYYATAATPGLLLAWPSHAGVVQPIRCYDPEPDILAADVMREMCLDVGYDEAEIDFHDLEARIRGMQVPRPMAVRACFEQLNTVASCDTYSSDARLKAVPRTGTPMLTIPDSHTGMMASEGGAAKPAKNLTHPADMDLPRSLTLTYVDQDLDYEQNAQPGSRQDGVTGGLSDVSIELAIAMSGPRARGIANERLFAMWNERDKIEGSLPSDYSWLDAGDVIGYRGMTLRLLSLRLGSSGIDFTACRASNLRPNFTLETDPLPPLALPKPPPLPTDLYLLDLPYLVEAQDQPSIAAAVVYPGPLAAFPGAGLYRGYDPELLAQGGDARRSAVVGSAATILPSGPVRYWDMASTVDISMPEREAARLETVTKGEVLEGRNIALLGGEVLQFRKVEVLDVGLVRLSEFLRGRRGTEKAVRTHALGDTFILLDPRDISLIGLELPSRGRAMHAAATTIGLDLDATPRMPFVPRLESLTPLAPCHLQGVRNLGGDLAVTWHRRARKEIRWMDWTGTPLDEPVERYLVQVLREDGTVARQAVVDGTSAWVYTEAMQTADWGGIQASLLTRVAQFSTRVGWGHAQEATL